MSYPVEIIPDDDFVYYRVHKAYIINEKVIPGAFRSIGDGMSVDWDRYSTVEESLARAKNPADNALVKFSVKIVRTDLALSVVHNPEEFNRAHSLINGIPETKGTLRERVRGVLHRNYQWSKKIA